MRLKKLIKTFAFTNKVRKRLILGPDVRLHPDLHRLQLQEQGDGSYKTDPDLYAKTWVTNPNNVKQWLGFEAVVDHPKDDLGQEITSAEYRLSDGTDEYWWDSGAWVTNTTDWNTEGEVANNIATFPTVSKNIQVITNLYTPDSTVTPILKAIKILYASDIEFQEDLIWRTLVPALRNNIRPISPFPIRFQTDSDTIDLKNDYKLETPYNVTGIDSVFNHTDDPNHWTDLFQSFDQGTMVITLNATVAADKVVWIRFTWEPEVAVTTGQEYHEQAKVPSIILDDINLVNSAETGQDDAVINKDARTGVKVPGPLQADIEVLLHGLTASARDQARLADELKRFFCNNFTIRSKGLDEDYRLWLIDEYDQRTAAKQSGLHAGRLRFRIMKALFFEKQAVDVYPVSRFNLTGDMNAVIS